MNTSPEQPYGTFNEREAEALVILQEECAELIGAVAKALRFGPYSYHPNDPSSKNIDKVVQELADVKVMSSLVTDILSLPEDIVAVHCAIKYKKLEMFSSLFKPKPGTTTSPFTDQTVEHTIDPQ